MAKKFLDLLSQKAKKEVENIVNNKENAIDMLVNNYYGKKTCSGENIVSRMQVQFFALNPSLSTLQTEGKDGWWQKEAYEPNTVNTNVFPLIETETTEDKWGKQYYSSFALKELNGTYSLRYPLDDDYTSNTSPFMGDEMNTANYNMLVRQVEKSLGVKIVDGKVSSLNLYKRSLYVLATTKIKNTALKLVGKLEKVATAFKGKLTLANKSKSNYKYTNIEKTVKIFDELFKVGITKQTKYAKKEYKKSISKDIQFASRLFADILMSRITSYGDVSINKKVEKCLALQFSNVLNRNNFSSSDLKLITDMATNTVVDTCKRMGYTKEKIVQKMTLNGYVYSDMPSSEKDALLMAHEKDYSAYMSSLNKNIQPKRKNYKAKLTKKDLSKKDKEENNTEHPVETMIVPVDKDNVINREKNQQKVAQIVPIETRVVPTDKNIEKSTNSEEINNKVIPVVTSLVPTNDNLSVQDKNKDEQTETHLIPVDNKLVPVEDLNGVYNLPSAEEKAALMSPEVRQVLPEGEKVAGLLPSGIHGYLPEGKTKNIPAYKPTRSRFEIDYKKLPFLNKIEKVNDDVIKIAGKSFSTKTIARQIDKDIDEILTNIVIKLTNASNANRRSSHGGKEKTQKAIEFLSIASCFYKKSLKKPINVTKMSKLNDKTVYSKSRQFVGVLNSMKNDIANKIMEEAKKLPPKKNEKISTYINRLSKNVCKIGDAENGVTAKKYFGMFITNISKYYINDKFENIFDKQKV